MKLEFFFNLLEQELKQNPALTKYHKFINNKYLYHFRKSYVEQRFNYLLRNTDKENAVIWDVGCGYGTTGFFLASKGFEVVCTTIEYYFDKINSRLQYWKNFIDLSKITFEYKNIFDSISDKREFDYIIAIDTLHHLEPFNEAVNIFHNSLKPNGKIIVCEENGNNLINNIKHFGERGFKKIINIYDEKLKKEILFGNENTRSLKRWRKEFSIVPFMFDENSIEYIRFYFPHVYKKLKTEIIIEKEQKLWKKSPLLREFFFFGINFVIIKSK